MEILGIGFSELVFIVIIILIVLGPKDMQKAGRTLGKWLNSIVTSDGWRVFQKTSRELRNLPNNLMREANIEKYLNSAPPPEPGGDTSSIPASRAQPFTHPPAPKTPDENQIAQPNPEQPQKAESDPTNNA